MPDQYSLKVSRSLKDKEKPRNSNTGRDKGGLRSKRSVVRAAGWLRWLERELLTTGLRVRFPQASELD